MEVRAAEPADAELICSLIEALAEYERARPAVRATPRALREALFGPEPQAEALVAELDGQPAGFALFFSTFSTWECRPGIWIEDLYVVERHRRVGVGRALFRAVAQVAHERGCGRLEWAALNWNEPALRFYERRGGRRLDDWITYRLDGPALERAAAP